MRIPARAKWIGLALLGLAIAVAVAIAASHLASEQIGIASESISAGEELAPTVGAATGERGDSGGPATTPTTTTPVEPTTTPTETTPTVPAETGDDYSGEDDGEGSGEDSDD